jgi:hypothetical protein
LFNDFHHLITSRLSEFRSVECAGSATLLFYQGEGPFSCLGNNSFYQGNALFLVGQKADLFEEFRVAGSRAGDPPWRRNI